MTRSGPSTLTPSPAIPRHNVLDAALQLGHQRQPRYSSCRTAAATPTTPVATDAAPASGQIHRVRSRLSAHPFLGRPSPRERRSTTKVAQCGDKPRRIAAAGGHPRSDRDYRPRLHHHARQAPIPTLSAATSVGRSRVSRAARRKQAPRTALGSSSCPGKPWGASAAGLASCWAVALIRRGTRVPVGRASRVAIAES